MRCGVDGRGEEGRIIFCGVQAIFPFFFLGGGLVRVIFVFSERVVSRLFQKRRGITAGDSFDVERLNTERRFDLLLLPCWETFHDVEVVIYVFIGCVRSYYRTAFVLQSPRRCAYVCSRYCFS